MTDAKAKERRYLGDVAEDAYAFTFRNAGPRADDGRYAEHNARVRAETSPVPSREQFDRLLNTAFHASLLTEESSSLRISLAFASRNVEIRRTTSIPFATPVPLTAEALRKLAPAADSGETFFGVDPQTLTVWGMFHVDRHRDRDHVGSAPRFLPYGAPGLAIRVLRPGVLAVYYEQHLQLLFDRGHLQKVEHRWNPDPILGPMRDQTPRELLEPVELRRGETFAQYRDLAGRLALAGRGGTLLVCLPGETPRGEKGGTRLDPPCTILRDACVAYVRVLGGEREANETDPQFVMRRVKTEDRLAEALDTVARFADVDGAVLMSSDLIVGAFGVKIVASDVPRIITVEDPSEPESKDPVHISIEELGGTRHQSAVRFCGAQPHLAFALVASQDGDLSLVAGCDSRVHIIRPIVLGAGL